MTPSAGDADLDGDPPAAAGDDLDELSTKELHDRAVRYAERHLDVKFFWSLLKAIHTRLASSPFKVARRVGPSDPYRTEWDRSSA